MNYKKNILKGVGDFKTILRGRAMRFRDGTGVSNRGIYGDCYGRKISGMGCMVMKAAPGKY